MGSLRAGTNLLGILREHKGAMAFDNTPSNRLIASVYRGSSNHTTVMHIMPKPYSRSNQSRDRVTANTRKQIYHNDSGNAEARSHEEMNKISHVGS